MSTEPEQALDTEGNPFTEEQAKELLGVNKVEQIKAEAVDENSVQSHNDYDPA